jgi:SulP family sulfate permease
VGRPPRLLAALATLLGVLVVGSLPGLFVGIGVSLLLLLVYRASRPHLAILGRTPGPDGVFHDLERHPDACPLDAAVVLRIEGSLYFANAENVRARIVDAAGAEGVGAVILDAETIPFLDVTAAWMLVAAHDELQANGVRLVLARAVGQVRDILGCTPDSAGGPAPRSDARPHHCHVRGALTRCARRSARGA